MQVSVAMVKNPPQSLVLDDHTKEIRDHRHTRRPYFVQLRRITISEQDHRRPIDVRMSFFG